MKHKTERLVGRPSPRLGDTGCEGACSPVPDIRFKEFREPWNAHLLGQMFEEREERSSEKSLLSVTMAGGVIRADENGKRDNSSADKSNYKCVYPGDLAYNSMRMWQGACGASIYEGIVSPAYTVMKPTNETDSFFFVRLFKQPQFLKVFKAFSQGLTSDTWNLKFPMLSTIPCQTPALPEQQKISSFFANLDQAIAAAQARLEKLRQTKVAMLKKMFPQPKQRVPDIRFKGFEGAWEKSQFSEELATVPHAAYLSVPSVNGKMAVIQQGDVPIAGYADKGVSGGAPVLHFQNIILFGDHTLSVYCPLAPFFVASDGLKIVKSKLGRPRDFLSVLLLAYMPKAEGYKRHFQILCGTNCWLPPSVAEQRQIAKFFHEMNALIVATEAKAKKLRQIKAALLEGMFV